MTARNHHVVLTHRRHRNPRASKRGQLNSFSSPKISLKRTPATYLCLILSFLTRTSSSSNYNTYNYDLTTPMFTPDGRLLQVEYASRAPSHSSPLVVVPFSENENEGVVIATLREQRRHKGQSRIVELPINSRRGTTTTTDHSSLVLGLSGILSDNVALLKEATQHLQSWYQSYGMRISQQQPQHPDRAFEQQQPSAVETARRIANVIGDACQMHSFGGGIRPFGASIVVCGVDRDGVAIYTTHPSGSVLKCPSSKKGDVSRVLVVGGDSVTARRSVEDKIISYLNEEEEDRRTSNKKNSGAAEAVKAVLVALLLADDASSSSNGDETPKKMVDIVLVTSKGGVQRLDDVQISRLLSSIHSSKS